MSRRQFLAELDRLEPGIRDEFLRWVADAVGSVSIAQIEAMIALGNVEAIAVAMGVAAAAGLADVVESVRVSYLSGGRHEALRANIRFDVRNPSAESWLREHSAEFVTRITQGQRDAIRATMESGTRLGRSPRQTALDIAGRIGETGRRTGGIVGLTPQQAGFVANAREQLLSGDPMLMREYFGRSRRDLRFDGIVRRSIAEGRPVGQADVDRITSRYADRLLQTRAESIARTEALNAFSEARDQAWRQAVQEGQADQRFIMRTWESAGDIRTRDAHADMNGQKRPFGVPFDSPTGAQLMHPGDTELGAGAEDVVQCRCYERFEVDYIRQQAARELM